MTTRNPLITFDTATDANFRAWGLAISTAIAALGFTKTSDTGQVDWATAVKPISTVVLYEVWQFNDALQATRPLFFLMAYGVGASAQPYVRFAVGTATSGTGTFSVSGALASSASSNFSSYATQTPLTTAGPCYFSGDGSSLTMALTHPSLTRVFFLMFIDRTRNADGTANGNGVVYGRFNGAGGAYSVESMSFIGGGLSAMDILGLGGGIQWPSNFWGTAVHPTTGDVYLYPMTVSTPQPNSPALAILGHYGPDIGKLAFATVPILGANHRYLCMGSLVSSFGPHGNCSVAIRYE